jgi:hypothetical protein
VQEVSADIPAVQSPDQECFSYVGLRKGSERIFEIQVDIPYQYRSNQIPGGNRWCIVPINSIRGTLVDFYRRNLQDWLNDKMSQPHPTVRPSEIPTALEALRRLAEFEKRPDRTRIGEVFMHMNKDGLLRVICLGTRPALIE